MITWLKYVLNHRAGTHTTTSLNGDADWLVRKCFLQ